MDPSRAFFLVLFRLDRLLDRLNTLLSVVYVTLVVVLLSLSTYVYHLHLYPLLHRTLRTVPFTLHTVLSYYFFLTIAANYLFLLTTSAGRPTPDPEAAPPPERPAADPVRTRSETWRHCTACRAAKPPRAHHCSACNACFHRLCHHCPAVGRCVGRDNYPFFLRFITSTWLGSLFGAATAAFLSRRARVSGAVRDVLFFSTVAGCAVGVAVGVLAAWHLYLLGTGQTTIEWLENVQMRRIGAAPPEWGRWGGPFSKGFRENIREAFGELPGRCVPWWLVLFLPVRRIAPVDAAT